MPEKIRENLIFAIGVLAFVIAGVSFVFAALDILSILQEADWDIKVAVQTLGVYEMIVDLVFSGLELAMGLLLIKQWKDKERVDLYKTLSRLINAVVYASFAKVAFTALLQLFVGGDGAAAQNIGFLYCIVYLAYYILSSSTGTLLRKRQWMPLYWMMLISSALAAGFCVYDCVMVLQSQEAAVEIGTTFANTLLMGLILVFSVGVIMRYAKDPDALWRDVLEGEDYDVVERRGGYEVVRIYATRAQEGAINVFILVLYSLCSAAGVEGIVLYALENNIGQYFGGSIQSLFKNIESSLLSGNMDEMLQVMLLSILVLGYPLIFLSQLVGAFRRQAMSKVNVISIVSIGTMLALCIGIGAVVGGVFEIINHRSIQWENYSLFEAGLIVLYLVFKFTKRIYANTTKEINDGVMQGDSYHSHSGTIARVCLFSGVFSVVGLGLIFAMDLVEGNLCVSYLLFASAILFAVVGALLEAKYPFSEFELAKRKIVESDVSDVGQKQEREGMTA